MRPSNMNIYCVSRARGGAGPIGADRNSDEEHVDIVGYIWIADDQDAPAGGSRWQGGAGAHAGRGPGPCADVQSLARAEGRHNKGAEALNNDSPVGGLVDGCGARQPRADLAPDRRRRRAVARLPRTHPL